MFKILIEAPLTPKDKHLTVNTGSQLKQWEALVTDLCNFSAAFD